MMKNGSRWGDLFRGSTVLGALPLLVCCQGEPETPESEPRTEDVEDLRFEVVVARAYPADEAVHNSPLAATINPCQTSLHVAFEKLSGVEDFDLEYRGTEAPSLVLAHVEHGDEVTVTGGTFLTQSVVFDLDPAVTDTMAVGVWSGEVMHGDELVATIPAIAVAAPGDANLDGEVGSDDLVGIFAAGVYETGAESSWGTGDFNCDGVTSSSDLVKVYQGKDGENHYGSGSYVGIYEPIWTNPEGTVKMTDYKCWLVGIGPESQHLTRPNENNGNRGKLDYSGMSVERTCSEPSYDPSANAGEPSSMVFYDARVSSFVTAECAWGGSAQEDADEDLAEVGESWSAGHATITSEGNASRDVRVVCEPLYDIFDDLDGDQFKPNDTCTMEVEGNGKGRATAHGLAQTDTYYSPDGHPGPKIVAAAHTTSELLMEFPDLSDLSDLEVGASDTPPSALQAHGTAVADADGSGQARLISGDDVKCRVGLEGGIFKQPDIYAQCFVEITAASAYEFVRDLVDDFKASGTGVTQVAHVAWARHKNDSPRTLIHRGEVSVSPYKLGAVSGKQLGRLRVYSKQIATSNSAEGHSDNLLASEATGRASGALSISIAFPDPETPDEYWDWDVEQQDAWDDENPLSRCRVGSGHREFAGTAAEGPEPSDENFVIRERGRRISVGVGDFDRRYWISRDGNTIQSYLERFGAW